MGEQFCLRWNNHQSTVVSVVESLLNSDSLTDCTLAAEGKYLKAHKLILTACSPYFESMLSHHHDKHPIFILKDVKYYELKAMLDYMYKGEVNISQDQLDSFIKTAESLQIKGLTDQGSGEGDSRDVGSTSKRKQQPPPMAAPGPESPQAGAAPAREGSPLAKRRRRHTAPNPQSMLEEAPSTPAPPDAARLAVVPKVEPQDVPVQSISVPQPVSIPQSVKSEVLEDAQGEDIEDLTLDDDDDEDYGGGGPDTSQPGTSFEGNSQASQDYSQWQMTGDRSTDEVFMAAQEAINSQNNSQGHHLMNGYRCKCNKVFPSLNHFWYHVQNYCGRQYKCFHCPIVVDSQRDLRDHMDEAHRHLVRGKKHRKKEFWRKL